MVTDHDNLEAQLARLTTWTGRGTHIWKSALARQAGTSTWRRVLRWRMHGLSVAVLAIAVLGTIAVVVNLPHLGGSPGDASAAHRDRSVLSDYSWQSIGNSSKLSDSLSPSTRGTASTARLPPGNAMYVYGGDELRGAVPPIGSRHVTRQAMIETVAADVRAAFLKARHGLQPERGEFVQDSSLTGTGANIQAHLTLRVAADRLADVLNELRGLGEVYSEREEGRDVTDQVLDLDARLRNERQVETELLELLTTREDAPLADVLALREKLGEIRGEIERLAAQRQGLRGLVELATVLVIIRPDGDMTPASNEFWGYVGDSATRSWQVGLRFLVDTLSTILRILVGGAVWWILITAVLLWYRHARRRQGG